MQYLWASKSFRLEEFLKYFRKILFKNVEITAVHKNNDNIKTQSNIQTIFMSASLSCIT